MYSTHNTYFKPPQAQLAYPRRSPSPPHSFIEPLSPTSARPRPIEPSFYYPALSNGQHAQFRAEPARQDGRSRKRGHHRVSSSIDTLADAALSIDAGYVAPQHRQHVYYGYGIESPHKRARSEAWPAFTLMESRARPLTSYNARPQQQRYETRVEDAALLLNFSNTGGKPLIPPPPPPPQQWYRPHPYTGLSQPIYQHYQQSSVPMYEQRYHIASPALPSPQHTSESKGPTPEVSSDKSRDETLSQPKSHHYNDGKRAQPQQTHTPPEELEHFGQSRAVNTAQAVAVPPKKRGWPKGKPRGPSIKKETLAEKPAASTTKRQSARRKRATLKLMKGAKRETKLLRRSSFSDSYQRSAVPTPSRSASVPRDIDMIVRSSTSKPRRQPKIKDVTTCNGCRNQRTSTIGELDEWIFCDGCKHWYHLDCAGFKKATDTRDIGKFFCQDCEPQHGKTTYVRKSTRAHTSVDYAELQRGQLKTSEESTEHHYIQPIKDGTFIFDPETFPRMRPELLTKDMIERSDLFTEPIVIPAEWNSRPWANRATMPESSNAPTQPAPPDLLGDSSHEYDCVLDEGQDKLDMVMPIGLTVRKVCNLVGSDTPLDVIDVKTQNSGAKWNLARWADYYESNADDKPVRNVISLEVSQTKLGRLLRRPRIVRDIDLQDRVWPQEEIEKGKWPKVQYYCLMSIADSYTDFHIDFGGSSVYYHLIKGKKTFFFIPPKPKHLKAYEEWNENPQQNFTFLPNITKECYRVDLKEGDTMLIPSGWIHAVWTPETSLVIGGNFLTHMTFKNQFRVAEIEKNNDTPLKFRYPFFQRLMWHTAMHYMREDPLPDEVNELFLAGQQYQRDQPIWQDFDASDDTRPGASNARYYSQAELDGLPELCNFIFRTVMMAMGRAEGITVDRMKRVNASIPKGYGEPLDIAKSFAIWVAWKRGNEDPPAWAHPDAMLPESTPKKLSARAIKDLERREAFKSTPPERQSKRVQKQIELVASSSVQAEAPADATESTAHDATSKNFETPATTPPALPSIPSPPMLHSPSVHQESIFAPPYDYSPPSTAPTTMMMSAFQGQHISTPKTSVLGPKRVACDACRRRRIRCKHKDFVVQAMPDMTVSQLAGSVESFGASGDDEEVQSQSLHDGFDGISTHESAVNGLNGAGIKLEHGARTVSFGAAAPGTNAYLDANIPMTLNGVNLFGDAKRGRSKACVECRKSKRRCIHDEQGNIDPIKAAELPVPRATPAMKKRQSEEALNNDDKRIKLASAANAQQGITGVLRPAKSKNSSLPGDWSSGTATPIDGISPGNHASLTIDPSLTATYPETNQDLYQTSHYAYDIMRPPMNSLPSLEEIATEVLDMDGGAGADLDETDLAAIQQYNQQTSGPELATEDYRLVLDGQADDASPQSTKSDPVNVGPAEEIATAVVVEAVAAAAATRARQDSIASLPVYRPPTRSPELTRASLQETKKEVSSPARVKHERVVSSPRVKHDRLMSRDGLQRGDAITA